MTRDHIQVCSQCGKAEGKNRKRHWERKHPQAGGEWKDLKVGETPTEPWCLGWLEKLPPGIKKLFEKPQAAVLSQNNILPPCDDPVPMTLSQGLVVCEIAANST